MQAAAARSGCGASTSGTQHPHRAAPRFLSSSRACRAVGTKDAELATTPAPPKRRVRFTAMKQGTQDVQELQTPLAQYMALPASQYSVLDGRKIERISDTTFRCYVGQLKMLKWYAEPVVTLSVDVEPPGCTIKLLSCELSGSPFIQDLNNRFTAQMTNQVRHRAGPSPSVKQITSDTTLQVEVEVPAWCSFISNAALESTGSGVLQNVLNLMVPRFLAQLEKDYAQWASGDTSRKPVGEL